LLFLIMYECFRPPIRGLKVVDLAGRATFDSPRVYTLSYGRDDESHRRDDFCRKCNRFLHADGPKGFAIAFSTRGDRIRDWVFEPYNQNYCTNCPVNLPLEREVSALSAANRLVVAGRAVQFYRDKTLTIELAAQP
jgi:hypothetical protein